MRALRPMHDGQASHGALAQARPFKLNARCAVPAAPLVVDILPLPPPRSAGSLLNARVNFYGSRGVGKGRCNEVNEYGGVAGICNSAFVRRRPTIGRGMPTNRPITRRIAVAEQTLLPTLPVNNWSS